MSSSAPWKDLERLVAKMLGGERQKRGADFSEKNIDVLVEDFLMLKIDAKYRKRSWSHHTFLREVKEKYCEERMDVPILVTKNPMQRGAIVSMDLAFFGLLLDTIRELREEAGSETL